MPQQKNFKYWFVNVFSVVISVLVQILLFKIISMLLISIEENAPHYITALLHIGLAIIAFCGACTTIYYSTNLDYIHIIIAMCVCIFLFTTFMEPPYEFLISYSVGACAGYMVYRKKNQG
jgi:hypothetical protein